MKSIMQTNVNECFFCGDTRHLNTHHVINGTGNRENSERYGLKVTLCAKHHDMVHRDQRLDLSLKKYAQKEFEKNHSREEWMQIFHKNYMVD